MKIDPKLGDEVIENIIQSFFSHGTLTEDDLKLSNIEFFTKLRKMIKGLKLGLVTDHRSSILKQAELFYQNKSYEYSRIFYAMFFEHSLNGILENECQRRKFDEKTRTDIIRSIDIHGKLTWLPLLLGHKKLNPKYVRVIKKLADDRNSFIHYKWKVDLDDDTVLVSDSQITEEFKNIKSAVRYIKFYESHNFFRKHKKIIRSKVRK
jgi:hypothetical protein